MSERNETMRKGERDALIQHVKQQERLGIRNAEARSKELFADTSSINSERSIIMTMTQHGKRPRKPRKKRLRGLKR